MIQAYRPSLNLIQVRVVFFCVLVLLCGAVTQAQDTGGALVGGAGIFRPKNPEAKRTTNPNRPTRPRPNPSTPSTRPDSNPDPAEIEEKFLDFISSGNDARDGRQYSAAEKFFRDAFNLKMHETAGYQ